MAESLPFAPHLYRGTADYYERFRPGYPSPMIDDLLDRSRPSGRGRLLDLACGTGQVTFAMVDRFVEVWAVDQEPDMIELVRAKAHAIAEDRVLAVGSAAEQLEAPAAGFEVVTIGNAFHRLPRDRVAALAHGWLKPGGYIVLLWASAPWSGGESWQKAFAAVIEDWKIRVGAENRVPGGWQQARERRSDASVLLDAGFEPMTSAEFPAGHEWDAESLIGFVYSTSVLPRAVFGQQTAAFEDELRRELGKYAVAGKLVETTRFAYELARRPR